MKKGDFQAALRLFEKIIDNRYSYTPEAYYYAAFAPFNLDQVETALLRLEQYLTVRPHDQAAMVDLGKLYERKGDIDSIIPDGMVVPWWLHEGIAQYESQNLTARFEDMMADLFRFLRMES